MENHINVCSPLGGGSQILKSVDPESPYSDKDIRLVCQRVDDNKNPVVKESFDQIDDGLSIDETPGPSADQRVPCIIESNDDGRFTSYVKNESNASVQLDLNYSEMSGFAFDGHLQVDFYENTERKIFNCFDGSNVSSQDKFPCNADNIGSSSSAAEMQCPEQLSTDFDYKVHFSAMNCVFPQEIEYLKQLDNMPSLEDILDGDDFNEDKESSSGRKDLKYSLNERAVLDEIIDDLIDSHLPKDSASLTDEATNFSSNKTMHTSNERDNDGPSTTGNHMSSYSSGSFDHIDSKVNYANELQEAIRDNIINEHIEHFRRLETLSTESHNSRRLFDICALVPGLDLPSSAISVNLSSPTLQSSVISAARRKESANDDYLEADKSGRLHCHEILEDSINQDELVSSVDLDLNDLGTQSSDDSNMPVALAPNLPDLSGNLIFNSLTGQESTESVQCEESSKKFYGEYQDEHEQLDSNVNDLLLESNTGRKAVDVPSVNEGYSVVLPINQSLLGSNLKTDLCDCADSMILKKDTESSYVAKYLINKLLDSVVDNVMEVNADRMSEWEADDDDHNTEVNATVERTNLGNKTKVNILFAMNSEEAKLKTQRDSNQYNVAIPRENESENLALNRAPEVIGKETISVQVELEVQLFADLKSQVLTDLRDIKSDGCAALSIDDKTYCVPENDHEFVKCCAEGDTHDGDRVCDVSNNRITMDSSHCTENLENNDKCMNEDAKADQVSNESSTEFNYTMNVNCEGGVEQNPGQDATNPDSVRKTDKIINLNPLSSNGPLATNWNYCQLNKTVAKISDLQYAESGTSTRLQLVSFDGASFDEEVLVPSKSPLCSDVGLIDSGSPKDGNDGEGNKGGPLVDSSDDDEDETQGSSSCIQIEKSNLEDDAQNTDSSESAEPSYSGKRSAGDSWLSMSLTNRSVPFNFNIKNFMGDDNCGNPSSNSSNHKMLMDIKNQDCFLEDRLTIEAVESQITCIEKDDCIIKHDGSADQYDEDEGESNDDKEEENAGTTSDDADHLNAGSDEVDRESFNLESQMTKCSKVGCYENDDNSDSKSDALEHLGTPTMNLKKRKHEGDDDDKGCLEIKKNRYVSVSGFAEVPDLSQCGGIGHYEDDSMYKEDEGLDTKKPLWVHQPSQKVGEVRSPEPRSTLSAFEEGVDLSEDMIQKFKEFIEKDSKQSSQMPMILEPCRKPMRIGLSRKYSGPHLHKYK